MVPNYVDTGVNRTLNGYFYGRNPPTKRQPLFLLNCFLVLSFYVNKETMSVNKTEPRMNAASILLIEIEVEII